jgi:acyl carrier protein
VDAEITIGDFKSILEEVLDRPGLDISTSTTAEDVEGWDSIAHIRLLIRIERTYNVNFPVDEVEKAQNVGELLALIQRLRVSKS